MQKVLTIIPIVETLGENYNFTTELYSRGSDGYVIKLGADPYLTASDLRKLINNINISTVRQIYIDESVIEPKDWGEGWQWDDDLNTFTPRFNSYNLDKNIFKFTIMPDENNLKSIIINPQKAPVVFINKVTTGEKNDIKISRNNITSSNVIELEGTVKTPCTIYVPNNNLKLYFNNKLTGVLEDRKIYLKNPYKISAKNNDDKKVAEITHSINTAIDDILQNSNNLTIETLSKLAGGKYYNKQGTDIDGIKLFNNYCENNGLDKTRVRIVDASGVSKNNLADADFISEFLIKNKNNKILQRMDKPGSGTLSSRMIILQNNLLAKTGTLSDISSIAGYLTTKSGKKYAFCIMINDPSSKNSDKKNLEDYLIRDMYLKF